MLRTYYTASLTPAVLVDRLQTLGYLAEEVNGFDVRTDAPFDVIQTASQEVDQ